MKPTPPNKTNDVEYNPIYEQMVRERNQLEELLKQRMCMSCGHSEEHHKTYFIGREEIMYGSIKVTRLLNLEINECEGKKNCTCIKFELEHKGGIKFIWTKKKENRSKS